MTPLKTWPARMFRCLISALNWALVLALITVPMGFGAVYGLLVLLTVWVVFYLVTRLTGRVPGVLDYKWWEFCIVVVLAVLLWYPLWVALFFFNDYYCWILSIGFWLKTAATQINNCSDPDLSQERALQERCVVFTIFPFHYIHLKT